MTLLAADAERTSTAMDRLLRESSSTLRVVDAAGHNRPAYPGLLVYAWRRAMPALPPGLRSNASFRAWRTRLDARIERGRVTSAGGALGPAETAAALAESAWAAAASGSEHSLWYIFGGLVHHQQPSGSFFPPARSVNPEALWYHELVLLHAMATRAGTDATIGRAVGRNAGYHLHETQPDHATNEPWGLLAFILNPDTRSLADQLLHTVRVQHPAGAQGVTAVLLADVLDHLRELTCRPG
jgi:hypothetical protein